MNVHDGEQPASFAEIAVSIGIAAQKLRLDLTHTTIVAKRIGLTDMGISVVETERRVEIDRLEQAFELFKKMSEVEPQVRAVLARKATRRWTDFARAAVV